MQHKAHCNASSAPSRHMSANIIIEQIELNSGVIEKQSSFQQIGTPSLHHLHDLPCCDLSSNLKWSHLNALTRTANRKQEESVKHIYARARARTHTHTHMQTHTNQLYRGNNLPQQNSSFRLKTNDMSVLHCSLRHVAPFLCKYNFTVHFQLFHNEWQAGLWLGLKRES